MKDLLLVAAGVAAVGTAAALLAPSLTSSAVADAVASAAEDVMNGSLEFAGSIVDTASTVGVEMIDPDIIVSVGDCIGF